MVSEAKRHGWRARVVLAFVSGQWDAKRLMLPNQVVVCAPPLDVKEQVLIGLRQRPGFAGEQ